ncbi:hypothetical protein TPE_2690 [Treponema pedis str. T A4]|uniref:Uncharacterized protein n=1 Tax=Treponema pedis str. T A4 TaxID=1291379 RepID=S5ZR54_9SPIR|nr:hypothetical protein TPE_2690 [Treponema pedis str. T A4]
MSSHKVANCNSAASNKSFFVAGLDIVFSYNKFLQETPEPCGFVLQGSIGYFLLLPFSDFI